MVADGHSERWHGRKRLYVSQTVAEGAYNRYINTALTAEASLCGKILKHYSSFLSSYTNCLLDETIPSNLNPYAKPIPPPYTFSKPISPPCKGGRGDFETVSFAIVLSGPRWQSARWLMRLLAGLQTPDPHKALYKFSPADNSTTSGHNCQYRFGALIHDP